MERPGKADMSTKTGRDPRAWITASCLCVLAVALPARLASPPPRAFSSSPSPSQHFAETLHYTITARVRPVLFWIGKDSVGEARMTWLTGEKGERGYELLIGSDPARAPRRINQWGYVREVEEQGAVRILGIMTDDEPDSPEQAPASAENAADRPITFKTIQATVTDGHAAADVRRVSLSNRLTFRDLDAVIAQVPHAPAAEAFPLPAGTQPGFLFAMMSLLGENVQTCLRTGVPPVSVRRYYVFGKKVYVVTTLSSRLLRRTTVRDREFRNVIQSEFEARVATAPKGETFRVLYGTEGSLRDVPIRIQYRPNWWFEAEVVLVNEPGRMSR